MHYKGLLDKFLKFSFFRILFGGFLVLREGRTENSLWFFFNRESKIDKIKIDSEGTVLDIGCFKGEFTKKLLRQNPWLKVEMFEPYGPYVKKAMQKVKQGTNVKVHQLAVTGDGRQQVFTAMGLRTKQVLLGSDELTNTFHADSIEMSELILSRSPISLLKINIEGMEYECFESIAGTQLLQSVKMILIQFHNFSEDHPQRRSGVQALFANTHSPIFIHDWKWELWELQSSRGEKASHP